MSLPVLPPSFVKVVLMNKISETRKKANVTSVLKKEDSRNNKPLSLTSVYQKSFPNKVIWSSQHGFMKGNHA